ncbi:unnamed protein product [Periconia digitata]|uniref:Heterokaryon incompatibility domain-containing protein n=1 Tax=Periconia digitata TaxID=1303443 RepID=A0A9W4UCI7_9PLEO|nr:unnamed protein product [Periconia digitata]
MEEKGKYLYCPIRSNEIRLCRFTRDADDVHAVLETFSKEAPHPKYSALSYTWGSDQSAPYRQWSIQIGAQSLPVLDSLWSFLQALRSKGTLLDDTWWWIDSICIDQTNTTERDEQVPQMKSIYNGASSVIIWLGEKSEDSNRALDFMHFLRNMDKEVVDREELRAILLDKKYERDSEAFKRFFLRRWWTRIWTVQEFVIPFDISFWCGERNISRDVVFDALMVADQCGPRSFRESVMIHHAFSRIRAWKLYRTWQSSGSNLNMPLLGLVAYFSSNEASDDRDRLYGLTGLSTEKHGLLIDYSRSVDEVYLGFAMSFIEKHASLDILSFASLYTASPGSTLPSWVPDWRKRLRPLVTPLMVSQSSNRIIGNLRPPRALGRDNSSTCYQASRTKKAVYSFEGTTLLARGYIVDTVDGLAGSNFSDLVQSSGKHLQCSNPARSSLEILASICRCLVLDRKDRYLQEPMPMQEFFDNFAFMALALVSRQKIDISSPFQDWFKQTRSLRLEGKTFENHLRDIYGEKATAIDFAIPLNMDAFQHDSFYGRFFDTVERMSLRLMTSTNGGIGMVVQKAMKGDVVCILFGCNVPLLLRRTKDRDNFTVVGECFLDGYMKGEALLDDRLIEETIRIV